jgi:RHS repeat-associated protein
LIEEANTSGAAVARYDQTQSIDEPLAMLRGGATSYYEADGLGSVTSLTSAAGALVQTYAFDSFGKQTASSGSLTNPFRYTAREFETETGLYYYRARYYDSTEGRFLSEDPIGFDGGRNFYAYVGNSPNAFSDPLGLCPAQNDCDATLPTDADAAILARLIFAEATTGGISTNDSNTGNGCNRVYGCKPFCLSSTESTSTLVLLWGNSSLYSRGSYSQTV